MNEMHVCACVRYLHIKDVMELYNNEIICIRFAVVDFDRFFAKTQTGRGSGQPKPTGLYSDINGMGYMFRAEGRAGK